MQASSDDKRGRVNLYIDGFNLYFGLRTFGQRYKWLDVIALAHQLCKENQQVQHVYYFTSRVKGPDVQKARRQTVYLDALASMGVRIVYGQMQKKRRRCKADCCKRYNDYEEKETDVNIATQLLMDAVDGQAEVYMIVTGDSDLTNPMVQLKTRFGQTVVAVFPPRRHSDEIKQQVGNYVSISEALLRKCQLPATVTGSNGYVLHRPPKWQ